MLEFQKRLLKMMICSNVGLIGFNNLKNPQIPETKSLFQKHEIINSPTDNNF